MLSSHAIFQSLIAWKHGMCTCRSSKTLTLEGFATNHNAAFRHARTPYFAVLNPDVRLNGNPFPALLSCMQDDRVGLCARLR